MFNFIRFTCLVPFWNIKHNSNIVFQGRCLPVKRMASTWGYKAGTVSKLFRVQYSYCCMN